MCYPPTQIPKRRQRRGGTRRGAMMPLIAILLPAMILFLGFAVDLAYMQLARVELQAVTDAAARAGASTLSKTDSKKQARKASKNVAKKNRVGGKKMKLVNADIQFGRSERGANGRYAFKLGGKPHNAVRVTGDRTAGSQTGAVSLFFGKMLGASQFEPQFVTTASFLNVDICLVLDRSTSMKVDVNSDEDGLYTNDPRFCKPPGAKTRWVALDAAVKVFTNALRESNASEQVALATYSSAYDPVVYCGTSSEAASIDLCLCDELDNVDSRVNELTGSVWNGNTNIEAGMRAGINVLLNDPGVRASADKLMIVMTDGNETTGSAEAAVADCKSHNIRVHTITFSIDANQLLMKEVARRGGGRHLHADTEQELSAAFRELAAQASQLTD